MNAMPQIAQAVAALLAGGAAASGWTAAVIVANTAFDGLDYGRADRHLRAVIVSTAAFQAGMLALAALLAVVSGAVAAFVVALMAGFGFMLNIWTLSPRRVAKPKGVRENKKSRRVVAVAFTLIFAGLAVVAGVLAALGI